MYLCSALQGQVDVCSCGPSGAPMECSRADEFAVLAEGFEHLRAHAGHDAHVGDDVGRVGELDADLGDGRAERAHAVGDDVHSAARAWSRRRGRLSVAFFRPGPSQLLVGPASLWCGADEGEVFDAGHVVGIGADEDAVGRLVGSEWDGGAGQDHEPEHVLVFLL